MLNFLAELDEKNESQPCFQVPRINFGSTTTVNDTKAIPHILTDLSLDTMRYRKHGRRDKMPPKCLIDLSKIKIKDIVRKSIYYVNPHRVILLCKNSKPEENELLVINHYVGSWESFSSRSDARGSTEMLERYNDNFKDTEDGLSDDNIRLWIDGFIDSHGEYESLALMKGAGVLSDKEWL